MSGSIDDVVMKLVDVYDLSSDSALTLRWNMFLAVMSTGNKPVYASVRTIREKWQVLHALGYLVAVNQHISRVNVEKLWGVVRRVRGEQ